MRPVIPVEPLPDLGAHVAEVKRLVHGGLGPLAVRSGDLVAAVVAGAEIVFEFGAEFFGDGGVFEELRVFAVAGFEGEGLGGYVLCYPVGVAGAAVVGGDEGGAGGEVGGGAGEAVVEEARGVDGGGAGGGFGWGFGTGSGGGGGGRRRGPGAFGGGGGGLVEEGGCGCCSDCCAGAGDDGEGYF